MNRNHIFRKGYPYSEKGYRVKDGAREAHLWGQKKKGRKLTWLTPKVQGESELFQKQRKERILSREEYRAMSSAASNSRWKKTEKGLLHLAIAEPLVTLERGISRKHFSKWIRKCKPQCVSCTYVNHLFKKFLLNLGAWKRCPNMENGQMLS